MFDPDRFLTQKTPQHVLIVDNYAHRSMVMSQRVASSLGFIPIAFNIGDLFEEAKDRPFLLQSHIKDTMALFETLIQRNRRPIMIAQMRLSELSLDYLETEHFGGLLLHGFKEILSNFPQTFLILLADSLDHVPEFLLDLDRKGLETIQASSNPNIRHELALRLLSSDEYCDELIDYTRLAMWARPVNLAELSKSYSSQKVDRDQIKNNLSIDGQTPKLTTHDLLLVIYHAMKPGLHKEHLEAHLARHLLDQI